MDVAIKLSSRKNMEKIELKCNEDWDEGEWVLTVQTLERGAILLLTGEKESKGVTRRRGFRNSAASRCRQRLCLPGRAGAN